MLCTLCPFRTQLPEASLYLFRTFVSEVCNFIGELEEQGCIEHFSFQAAGYTLSELLPLCRSSILQQRVLAINTLARISQRGRQGEYAGVIEGSVVGRLLEAEVPLLLRYALDDSNDAMFYVAIHALHSLLVLMPEEVSNYSFYVILRQYTYMYTCMYHTHIHVVGIFSPLKCPGSYFRYMNGEC